ncbi:hypothetical protein [Fimbriiglobus ruber]|uniref:Uncharacterized protein n=1 Tax=Fimbriiglobus ruber TaxID=1908690 RepID=A0A225E052_9BACT|nr:hypothetical protein [Fimbriiglobus ruber]OWK41737.1 hypothetical protein FRUB_03815 [Fimbriiglobus ruber]
MTNATPMEQKPAATRLWVILQQISRHRDLYARDKTRDGKVTAARTMLKLTAEVQTLAAELLAEAEQFVPEPVALETSLPVPTAGQ